jgi:glycosyltransferase involved in cell wall biosynthesis
MTDLVLATLSTGTPMGQQEYERQLARHLSLEAPDLSVRAVRVRSLRSSLDGEARLPLRVTSRLPPPAQALVARAAYGRARLVHRADLRLPAARREVVTVHDLAPLRFPDEGELVLGAAQSLHRARAIICPSQFAATELSELLGVHDATVIHNGLDPRVWDDAAADALAGLGLPERFVLHSGGATERKNLAGLAAAWAETARAHPGVGLVLCGPADARRDAAFAGLPRVRLLGRVDREQHLALMSAAAVVVVPSTYEGFGFPALEAMARGTVVVAARCGSLPEVCGDAALLTLPSGEGLAVGLNRVLSDAELRRRLVAAGRDRAAAFTWERCAREHVAVYRAALRGRSVA